MKGQLLSISFSFVFLLSPLKKTITGITENKKSVHINNRAEAIYNDLHLEDAGLSKNAFEYAYTGYRHLVQKQRLENSSILSICDLSQPSNKKRLYILDLSENKILLVSYVAHGKGSGMEYATRFSNKASSHETSLGFYVTGSTYYGEHGLSLRLQGLEPGFNDHAVRRNIVVHGAEYVGDDHLDDNRFMGRSYGCPAVPQQQSAQIINLIKDGSCLFIYHPTKIYLQKSKILND